LAALAGAWLAFAPHAQAASLTKRDVLIIAKVLGFLEPAPHGGTVAVVYAAGTPGSKADADAIASWFGDGLAFGGGTVTAKAIEAGSFGAGTGFIAVILAKGAEVASQQAQLAHGMLTITAADSLVRSGQCVMVVHSEPRVDITISHHAADAAGVAFTAAFGMLVHEE
jgi:hypothetical protein